MWNCPQCNASVGEPLAVCWRCGTAADGELHPAFRDGLVRPDISPSESSTEPERTRPQFSLRALFVFVTVCAACCSFLKTLCSDEAIAGSILAILFVVVVGNVLSATVGKIVTPLLPEPDEHGNYP